MITNTDLFGHASYLLLFIGTMLLQAKNPIGWLLRAGGELGWIGVGFAVGMSSIWLWGFVFLVADVLGYFRWFKTTND